MREILLLCLPLLPVAFGLAGCRVVGTEQARGPAIVAHRGASSDAPENTLAAFKLGFDQGADAIEGDFRMTLDGRIVAMHDRRLERTTGDPRTVDEVTLDEIRRLDAGSWGAWRESGFEGEPVPTLEEVLQVVPDGKRILVEVKDTARIVDALVATLEGSKLRPDQATVISFDAEVVEAFKRAAPAWTAFWLTSFEETEVGWRPTAADVVATAIRIGADGVDVRAVPEVVDEGFVRTIRAAGLEVHVWTVNDLELARRMESVGVDSITTDRPVQVGEATSR